jgi:GTP:adenosylcobinamide-phosphate guanylyltransferase
MPDANPANVRALVLAGRRAADERSPGGALQHKALEPVGGVAMLERVVTALEATGRFASIAVCSDDASLLRATPRLAAATDRGVLCFAPSGASPAASVAAFLAADGAGPVLATAADHALLEPEWVVHFLDAASATGADAVVAVVESSVFRRAFPDARRTFVPLRGDAVSGANLFLFRTPRGADVARFWVRAESFRKRPWRMVAVFGPVALARFALRRLDLDGALGVASRVIGARVAAVRMPFAESAIDVDTPDDLELANRLAARKRSAPRAADERKPSGPPSTR